MDEMNACLTALGMIVTFLLIGTQAVRIADRHGRRGRR
jgi:hypothetical protein